MTDEEKLQKKIENRKYYIRYYQANTRGGLYGCIFCLIVLMLFSIFAPDAIYIQFGCAIMAMLALVCAGGTALLERALKKSLLKLQEQLKALSNQADKK